MAGPATVLARPKPQKIDTITIDSADEQHDHKNDVTTFPVEQGMNISDHVRPQPDTLSLNCMVSNTPIDGPEVQDRANQVYQALYDLRMKGTMVDVVTTLRVYRNMVVASLSLPRNVKNANGLEFTIAFQYIIVVSNRLTRTVIAKAKKAQKKKDLGAANAKDATDKDKDPMRKEGEALAKGVNAGLKALGFGPIFGG